MSVSLVYAIVLFPKLLDFYDCTGCAVLAFLSSTQDIATDGLSRRLLSEKERGLGNGIQSAGGMLGNLLGGGAVLMAYPYLGWKGCMVILASVSYTHLRAHET